MFVRTKQFKYLKYISDLITLFYSENVVTHMLPYMSRRSGEKHLISFDFLSDNLA